MGFTQSKLDSGSGPYRAGNGVWWEGLKSCGDNKEFVDPISIKVSPNPLRIVEGEEIEVHFYFHSHKPIKKGFKIKLKVEKKVLVWIEVPCTEKEGGHFFGSCEYPIDLLMDKLKTEMEEKKLGNTGFECAPPFLPEGQTCDLPLKPGFYGSEDESTAVKLVVPQLPPHAKSFIDGKLRVKGELIDENGESVVCLKGEIELTSKTAEKTKISEPGNDLAEPEKPASYRALVMPANGGAWRMGFTQSKLDSGSGPYRAGNGVWWEGLKSCGDNKEFVDPISIKVSPNPLRIVEGEEIEVHFYFHSHKPIKKGFKIKLKVEKKVLVWIEVPCTEKEGGHFFGSCEYPIDLLMDKLKTEMEEKKLGNTGFECAPPFLPEGQTCDLPLKPGFYGSEDESTAVKLVVPKLPPIAKGFIDGKLRVKGELIDENGVSVVCLKGEIELTSK